MVFINKYYIYIANSCAPSLTSQYKKQAKRLRQTGGSIGKESQDAAGEYLDFYIPPEGPNDITEDAAKNLWGGSVSC